MVDHVCQSDEHVLTMLPRRTRGVLGPDGVEYIDHARGFCSCGWKSAQGDSTDDVAAEHAKHCALMEAVGA